MPTGSDLGNYDPQQLETKWQNHWVHHRTWNVKSDPGKKKYYVLDMFPYPSGRIHMGHVRNYTLGDVIARIRRAQGFHVLHPMGWDAFGLPAENAAIKNKVHPEKWTHENILHMREQLIRLGLGYDWTREITTCLPEYYKWEQKIFIEMFEKGLAYRKASTVNWCPTCQTVLANEQVEDGKCWRCESETTTRELEQWCLRITRYAEELLRDIDTLSGWPDQVKTMQKFWIGKSEGAEIEFALENGGVKDGKKVTVFTTRPDTLMGATFLALAPEHPWALEICKMGGTEKEGTKFIEHCRKQTKIFRTSEDSPKEGLNTGAHALHPITGEKIPLFLANFVLIDYGTGALMAVPAHDHRDFAFAKKYGLPIRQVISAPPEHDLSKGAYTGVGVLLNSGDFDNLPSEEAKKKITQNLSQKNLGKEAVQFRLRDWGLSRQRYWGTPIPMIYCKKCGVVPEKIDNLPVTLPTDVEFTGEGESPLAKHPLFNNIPCPRCGTAGARRETDTMDTFMESSWYYLRYLSPHSTNAPFEKEDAAYWLGVDQYIGGIEHATMHLLYFRFFHKVLRDMGYFPKSLAPQDLNEPVRRLFNQGIVYKDGAKMSKSKGNVVDPDAIVSKYGADTARVFSMFAAPPEKVLEWSDQGIEGASRFLFRLWRLIEKHQSVLVSKQPYSGKQSDLRTEETRQLRSKIHQTIKKYVQNVEQDYHFNSCIALIMELVNEIYLYPVKMGVEENLQVLRESVETAIRLLSPFAPHICAELWQALDCKTSLDDLALPTADPDALLSDTVTYAVQINGKLRGDLEVGVNLAQEKVVEMILQDTRFASRFQGVTIVKTIFVPKRLVNFVVKET